MPKPPLTRPSWWDSDIARDLLKERVATTAGLGGRQVRLSGEPLLRHDGTGGLLQSIRVGVLHPGGAHPRPRITRARVSTAGAPPSAARPCRDRETTPVSWSRKWTHPPRS